MTENSAEIPQHDTGPDGHPAMQSEEDRLKVGLTANADIAVQRLDGVMMVPSQAPMPIVVA